MTRHDHAALPIAGLLHETAYLPACDTPGCTILAGLTFMPHPHPEQARDESERLHHEAEHGPSEPGQLGDWEGI